MACCVLWVENQRKKVVEREGEKKTKKKHQTSVSYLKKHFSTSNCKEKEQRKGRGETEERGGNKRERKKKLVDCRAQLQNNNFLRHLTGECVN